MNILLLARWPVGGIRTYFRYVYGNPLMSLHHFTIVAPDKGMSDFLENHLKPGGYEFIPTQDSSTGLLAGAARLLRKRKFDLVHSHGLTAGTIGILLSCFYRFPHLMTMHDMFRQGQFDGWQGMLRKQWVGAVLRHVDMIHTVSHDSKRNLLEYFPSLDESGIRPILHGIDQDMFVDASVTPFREQLQNLSEDHFLIGFFGRFMAPKGFRDLVNAIGILSKSNNLPRVPRVLTFGEGGFVREDYEMIAAMGLDEYFIRLPFTDDVAGAIKGMDLVVMPSLWEACGLLAMETLVSGVPLVGTSCIGLREVLEGTPASVVPPADPGKLAEMISYEMGAGRRHEFVEYVPQALRRFSVHRHASELVRLYEDLASL